MESFIGFAAQQQLLLFMDCQRTDDAATVVILKTNLYLASGKRMAPDQHRRVPTHVSKHGRRNRSARGRLYQRPLIWVHIWKLHFPVFRQRGRVLNPRNQPPRRDMEEVAKSTSVSLGGAGERILRLVAR
jgi:hypothetical protein